MKGPALGVPPHRPHKTPPNTPLQEATHAGGGSGLGKFVYLHVLLLGLEDLGFRDLKRFAFRSGLGGEGGWREVLRAGYVGLSLSAVSRL